MPSDRYQQLTALPPGRFVAKRLGLPESRPLRRYEPGQPALAGPALRRRRRPAWATPSPRRSPPSAPRSARSCRDDDGVKLGALVFDATGIEDSTGLQGALRVLPRRDPRARPERPARRARHAAGAVAPAAARPSPSARSRASCAPPPRSCARARRASSSTSRPGAEANAESTLRFLLSAHVRLRLRPGDPDRRRRRRPTRRTGSGRWPAAWRSSPAPRAASAPRSPARWRATARPSSASTSPPRATTSPRSSTSSAAPRCCSTSPTRTRPRGSPST